MTKSYITTLAEKLAEAWHESKIKGDLTKGPWAELVKIAHAQKGKFDDRLTAYLGDINAKLTDKFNGQGKSVNVTKVTAVIAAILATHNNTNLTDIGNVVAGQRFDQSVKSRTTKMDAALQAKIKAELNLTASTQPENSGTGFKIPKKPIEIIKVSSLPERNMQPGIPALPDVGMSSTRSLPSRLTSLPTSDMPSRSSSAEIAGLPGEVGVFAQSEVSLAAQKVSLYPKHPALEDTRRADFNQTNPSVFPSGRTWIGEILDKQISLAPKTPQPQQVAVGPHSKP